MPPFVSLAPPTLSASPDRVVDGCYRENVKLVTQSSYVAEGETRSPGLAHCCPAGPLEERACLEALEDGSRASQESVGIGLTSVG